MMPASHPATNQQFYLFLFVALVISAIILTLYFRPSEPGYDNKSLSEWLADLDLNLRNLDHASVAKKFEKRARAVRAVRAIGTNAFPMLKAMLCKEDSLWAKALIRLNAKATPLQIPVTPANVLQFRAVQAFGELRELADSSVPILVQILEEQPSPQIRCRAGAALGQIGPAAAAAVPALRKAAEDTNPQVRRSAETALVNIERNHVIKAQIAR